MGGCRCDGLDADVQLPVHAEQRGQRIINTAVCNIVPSAGLGICSSQRREEEKIGR